MKRTLLFLVPAMLAGPCALAEDVKVGMKDSLFSPATVTVHAGDRVVWINDDEDGYHQVYFENPSFRNSENIKPGKQFSVVFDKPGEVNYYCRTHKDYGMKGKVVVVEKAK